MGKKSKSPKGKAKNAFGLSADDRQELRKNIRAAVKNYGEGAVLDKLGFESVEDACDAVNAEMTRSDYGVINNALKSLEPPKTKTNKYAHLAQQQPKEEPV